MTPNINLALVVGFFGTLATLIVGYFKYKTDREKNKNDLTVGVWQQFREDNKTLSAEVKQCRTEIKEMDAKLDQALADIRLHKAEKEKAEEECKAAQKRADIALESLLHERETAARWEAAYHGEHAAYLLLHHLYDELREGRPPDAAMLETIRSRLVELASPVVVVLPTVVPAVVSTL